MGVEYGIHIILNASYNPKNLEQLIKNGYEIGISYRTIEEGILSIEEAVTKVSSHKGELDDPNTLEFKMSDGWFSILFYPNERSQLGICVSPGITYWVKKNDAFDLVFTDVGQYIEVVLHLCTSFKIIEFTMGTSF